MTTYLVLQDFRLTDDLTGNLWYIRTCGDKATGKEQQGLFLIRSVQPEDADPEDLVNHDMEAFEAWWQLALPMYAPMEEKMRVFRESGVLWLDKGQLSLFFPSYVLKTSAAKSVYETKFPLANYYASHYELPSLLMLDYRFYCKRNETFTGLLADYLDTHIVPGTYEAILARMREYLQALYDNILIEEPKNNPLWPLCMGMSMLLTPKLSWWNCTELATMGAKGNVSDSYSWSELSIAHALVATILASYWIAHPDLDATEPYHSDLTTVAIPLPERLQLWETYLSLHHDRIVSILNLEDTRTKLPTEDEIRLFLLREELKKVNTKSITALLSSLSASPIPDANLHALSARISTYTSQFYEFLGYMPEEHDNLYDDEDDDNEEILNFLRPIFHQLDSLLDKKYSPQWVDELLEYIQQDPDTAFKFQKTTRRVSERSISMCMGSMKGWGVYGDHNTKDLVIARGLTGTTQPKKITAIRDIDRGAYDGRFLPKVKAFIELHQS